MERLKIYYLLILFSSEAQIKIVFFKKRHDLKFVQSYAAKNV